MGNAMGTLGDDLRREREQRSLSLRDISDQTKISFRYLEALEGGRAEQVLEPFYIKSILRTYAKVLGLPEDHFLALYLKETPHPAADLRPKRPAPGLIPQKRTRPPRRKLRRDVAIALALVLALVAALVYVFVVKPSRAAKPALPAPAPAAPVTAAAPLKPPPSREADAIDEATDLRLELTFNAETWIHIAADGLILIDGLKQPGEAETLTARREFVLWTGNAGGFTFTVNGRPCRTLGASGAVLTNVRINRETLPSFLMQAPGRPEKAPDR